MEYHHYMIDSQYWRLSLLAIEQHLPKNEKKIWSKAKCYGQLNYYFHNKTAVIFTGEVDVPLMWSDKDNSTTLWIYGTYF